jgi:hypothetical protein
MLEHNVSIRYYADGSVSIHARKDDVTDVNVITKWAYAQEIESEVFEKTRTGLLEYVRIVQTGLSKSEAAKSKKTLKAFFESLGRKVINEG